MIIPIYHLKKIRGYSNVATGVVFHSHKEYDSLLENGYMLFPLDENEYAYVKGDSNLELMREYKHVDGFE